MARTPPLHATRNDLAAATRRQVVDLLNQSLADASDLYSQVKQAHWNVKGPTFMQLHELFDKLAETVEGHIDMLAERATALGGLARGTVRLAAAGSRLTELASDLTDGQELVAALADRFAAHGKSSRAAIGTVDELGDAATADLYTEIARDLDQSLWFLESHLAA